VSAYTRRQVMQGAGAMGLGLLAGCGRWPGQGQPPTKVPRIGMLMETSLSHAPMADAFRQGLSELGYVEGQNILIEYRSAEGQDERYPALAAELVGLPIDVLVTGGVSATQAAKQATRTLPIVFGQTGDPVGTGLVASLARPGGNLTGLSNVARDLSAKRLELLQQTVPGLASVAVLLHPATSEQQLAETQDAAQRLGLRLLLLEVRQAEDLERAFATASEHRAEAMTILGAHQITASAARLAALAGQHHLPAIYPVRVFADEGGLMTYGSDVRDQYRRAAYYVDRILKGAKPADLPVEQPMRFDFVINLKTAQALGLTIPQHVLLQATEVIQ
jgi:putative tryptophan/tyrosine transport system substrate-binding protein